ncbi:hypothetical protein [Duganella sp. P38]|uniref:hypothetical protein n=1 Tax=Duganella sp. P38 TaxID=3423949 RepID=UPI003D7B982A
MVEIVQITPEITGVLVGFRLSTEFSSAYEVALNADRNYVHRPIFGKFTYTTLGVELLKREAVDKIRADSKQIISTWFRRHLRGFFISTSGGLRLPTAELLSCHNDIVLTQKGHGTPEKAWCRLLTPYGFGDVWASLKYPGFRILSTEPVDDMPFHTIFSIQISTLPAEEFSIYGGINSGTVVKFAHENLSDFLCQNAMLYVLHEIRNKIKENRQKLNIRKTSYRSITKSIERIKDYFEFSVGIPIILTDLRDFSKRKNIWNSYIFFNAPPWPQEEPAQLSEVLRNHVKFLSQKTANEELSVREHFEQLASIMSTQESVKAQKRMEFLTYLTIVLALSSLIVSLSPDTWIKETKAYLDRKINQKPKPPNSF